MFRTCLVQGIAFAVLAGAAGLSHAQSQETIGAPVASQGGPVSPFASLPRVPAGTVLFDEFTTRFVTSANAGAGGAPVSAIQGDLGMTLFGAGSQIGSNNWVAEDFTVPAQGWSITTVRFYTYQSFPPSTTSTITDLRVQVFSGAPGGTLVAGDAATNRLASTTWTGIYRVTNTTLTNTDRPVMEVVGQFDPPINLTIPGTYWIAWSLGGTLASGPWTPPQTVVGQTVTGNCQQSLAGGAFAQLLDAGSGTAQGCPLILEGATLPVTLQNFSID